MSSLEMDRFLQGVFIDFETQTGCCGVRAAVPSLPFLAGLGRAAQSSR